jgi:hypothetical protein
MQVDRATGIVRESTNALQNMVLLARLNKRLSCDRGENHTIPTSHEQKDNTAHTKRPVRGAWEDWCHRRNQIGATNHFSTAVTVR